MSDKPQLRFILCLGSITALGPLSIDMYLPALPHIAGDFHASPSTIQASLSACILGLSLGQLLVGPVSDAVGRRRPLFVGLAAYALMSVLCLLAPTASALVAARFAQGLAGSAALVIATAVARDLYHGAAAARFFSLLMLVMGLAPILAPVLGAQVLRVVSWHGIFAVLAVAGLLLLAVTPFVLPETLPPERRHPAGFKSALAAFANVLADRHFLTAAAVAGLAFAAMFAYIAGSSFVLQNIYGLSPQAFGTVFGANALGLIAMSQVNGRLVHRVGLSRLMAVGLGGLALGAVFLLAAVVLDLGLYAILACLFVVVASQGLVAPNASALALANHGRAAGSASALLGTLRFVIGAVAAPMVGMAGEGTALPMAVVISVCGLAALVTAIWVGRSEKREA
ncbi:MAG TPA: Bcr/CflA family multidrug efflux MFS transporter [Magnetospirillum sp.]|jgi:DHA1 family bicyclomycin/chloramphenicol resistance-like MFS transporter|nr:Bcr/CflA family multidrug efflux MFS transporter [Magnetospirillum sp.]